MPETGIIGYLGVCLGTVRTFEKGNLELLISKTDNQPRVSTLVSVAKIDSPPAVHRAVISNTSEQKIVC